MASSHSIFKTADEIYTHDLHFRPRSRPTARILHSLYSESIIISFIMNFAHGVFKAADGIYTHGLRSRPIVCIHTLYSESILIICFIINFSHGIFKSAGEIFIFHFTHK
jgi:hypothetical protein